MVHLFKRSSMSVWHFLFFVILSFGLMFLDSKNSVFTETLRNCLSIPVKPLRALVEAPFDLTYFVKQKTAKQVDLLKENQRLRHEKALLLVRLSQWNTLEQENRQLHALLKTSPEVNGKVSGAKVLSMDTQSGNASLIILNKGRLDNVFIGQPVLDGTGFIGHVIRVDYFNSVVLLITDLKSAIPVEVLRTGERGILAGSGSVNKLWLNNLPKTSHVKPGDILITSNLAGNSSAGYPVGTIRSIQNEASDMFAKIAVTPVAEIQKDHEVFLLWPNAQPKSLIIPVIFPKTIVKS